MYSFRVRTLLTVYNWLISKMHKIALSLFRIFWKTALLREVGIVQTKGPQSVGLSSLDAQNYLISWKLPGDSKRTLEAGFRPDVYRKYVSKSLLTDPYCHFLTAGRPDGPWVIDLITESSPETSDLESVAVHIHAYYSEELDFILGRIALLKSQPLVFVTAFSGLREDLAKVLHRFAHLRISEIWLEENTGRDLGPFFKNLPDSFWEHEVIFHVHTKRSEGEARDRVWFESSLQQLIGTEETLMAPKIVSHLQSSTKTGIVMPTDLRALGWGLNFFRSCRLSRGIFSLPAFWETFVFPVGSMFAAKPEALKTLFEISARTRVPKEPLPRDGTDLHALERLVCLAANSDGHAFAFSFVEERG